MTRALVTNDDGIDSPGLSLLATAAVDAGFDVLVAAPSWDSSGASAALTGVQEDGRIRAERGRWIDPSVAAISVEAAPAMITLAALRGAFGHPPDIVLSGINRGRNTGAAILHSGTVGAALTAANHGVTALAVSVDSDEPMRLARPPSVVSHVVAWLSDHRPHCALNLNLPPHEIDATELIVAPLASVGAVQTSVTDSGEGFLHVTYAEARPPEPGTDAALLAEGRAVITPLSPVGFATDVDIDSLIEAWASATIR
jgi:5'-nucleotidase